MKNESDKVKPLIDKPLAAISQFKSTVSLILLGLVVVIILLAFPRKGPTKATDSSESANINTARPSLSPLDQLERAPSANISPKGELAEMFSYGNDFTDLQRQLKIKEIQGQVVEWRLPVYEVMQAGDGYIIQTSSHAKGDLSGPELIGTFLRISPRSEVDRGFVERLKTGDFVKFKGIVEDVTMRNLYIKPAILTDDERLPKHLLSKAYGKYNKKFDCWHTVVTNLNEKQKYCMKLGRIDMRQVNAINRYYVLSLGDIVDDEGKPNGAHFNSGLVGAFVMEVRNGEPVTIASNTAMQMGNHGNPPTSWEFVRLGSADYWGWQTASGDCNQGECYDHHILLAPLGTSIRDLTGGAIGGSRSDSGQTSVSVKLAIDSSQSKAQVFPLLLTVTGEFNDKTMPTKNLTVPFDIKAWKYAMPKEWPQRDQEAWWN